MRRTYFALASLSLWCGACGQDDREPEAAPDCSASSQYEFLNIKNFAGDESGWFQFADPTPGAIPNPAVDGSNVPTQELATWHCGASEQDHKGMRLRSVGHNFYGSGYGDWEHNDPSRRADGTGYSGISFWARAERGSEKQFLLSADDGRTLVLTPEDPATAMGQDLNGDGQIGPGDIVAGTSCRLPPPAQLGEAVCYSGDVGGPTSSGARVPGVDECGNAFHTRVTLSDSWQLVLIPFRDLVQWPCPNRLEGGIEPGDLAKLEIKLLQGATYDFWVDDFAFYR